MAHPKYKYAWCFLVLIQILWPSLVPALSPDGMVLLEVKEFLLDDSHVLDSWNSSDEFPCSWRGISCDPASRSVTKVNLTAASLSGELSSELCNLPNLESLVFSSNEFVGPRLPAFYNCSKLQELDLSNNSFTGGITEDMLGMAELRTLLLNNNLFKDQIPPGISSLRQLRRLNLASLKLYGRLPDSLGDLTNLVALDLSNNDFFGEIPAKLGNLTLTEFNVSYNELSGPVPDGLSKPAYRDSFLHNPKLCDSHGMLNLPRCTW